MTITCLFFLATEDEAATCHGSQAPTYRFPTLVVKGMDEVMLGQLASLLDPALEEVPPGTSAATDEVVVERVGGAVHTFTDGVLSALAGICDDHLEELAYEWTFVFGWDAAAATPTERARTLIALRRMARHARAAGCGMFLRMYAEWPGSWPPAKTLID
jgi:hypothetical protein